MAKQPGPRVAVIMAVHNGASHLRAAIDSILTQSLADFEFLIVDDASTDATPDILAHYAAQDARIRLIRNPDNIGPYPSANRALDLACAPVIARMDGDDISAPDRLQRQVGFLDTHPDHLLVGCGYRSIDAAGRERYARPNPLDDFGVRWVARFRMPMVHPGICFRARYRDGRAVRYPDRGRVAQDFALVAELLSRGKAASLGDMLVQYRMHERNISSTRRADQDSVALEIVQAVMRRESGAEMARNFLPLHETLYHKRPRSMGDLGPTRAALRALYRACEPHGNLTWMKRRASGYLAEAYLSDGSLAEKLKWAALLALAAPGVLPALAMRLAEARGLARSLPNRAQD